jgi:hypothetical protein
MSKVQAAGAKQNILLEIEPDRHDLVFKFKPDILAAILINSKTLSPTIVRICIELFFTAGRNDVFKHFSLRVQIMYRIVSNLI